MSDRELVWFLFLAWGFFSLCILCVQLFITRRFLRKIETAFGPKFKRKRIKSAVKKKDSAMVAFDGKNEAFYWNGTFEDSKAMYSINAETGYACLKLEKEGAALNIYQYERDVSESRITSLVPYKLELNGRTVYNTSLLKESGEKKLIYEILKDYFKRGVKRNAEFLSLESQESINALIFGYHTFQRFKAYIKESYPDFCREIESYKRKSIKESLSLFQPGEKTGDELEIEIRKAVFEEDYERAARIRDQLKKLNQPGSPKGID